MPKLKPIEKAEARRLRAEEGYSLQRIAGLLGVSVSSVFVWTREVELPAHLQRRSATVLPLPREFVEARARAWAETTRERRRAFQSERRCAAQVRDPIHQAGCTLYWAEGGKKRNSVELTNSDMNLVRFFVRFLRASFGLESDRVALSLKVYTGNGLSISEIESHWLAALELPQSCLRKHQLNHMPTSSGGSRRHRLPYGVARVAVGDTRVVQHIYGAIQE